MYNRKLIILLLGILSLISACTYSDYGSHFVEPIPDDPPIVSVTTNLDTIVEPVVSDSLEVIYDIELENGELYYVDAKVGNYLVYDSDTTHGSFWLYPSDVQLPGIDTLYMQVYYSTNTNSLADALGLEAFDIKLSYGLDFKWTP